MNIEKIKKRWYTPEQYNSDIIFRKMIYKAVDEDSHVLDVGAGVGEKFAYNLKNHVAEIVGVDVDPQVETNPLLHRGIVSDIVEIPIVNSYFDVVFSRYVLEHITEPQNFLNEMNRILKPGGRFIFLTPNKWHYVSIAASLSPHWFHKWYNLYLRGRKEVDTFPTVYYLNTASTLRRQLISMGFEEDVLLLHETCPNYLLWSAPSFYLGLAYERLVNSFDILEDLKVNLLGCFKKKED
ncbi:class I SAM-dependent methyltransferase [Candidatus Latescibacterota bacterium]